MITKEQYQHSKELIQSLNFCVIDLETTGGNHEKDRIIEIGLVKISQNKINESKSFLLDPRIKIPDFIQKLTSIKQKDIEGQPYIEDVIEEIIQFIGDDILIAHNTSFDIPFLNAVLKRLGRDELENKVICTNVMTKHLIPHITSSNLTYMSKLFGLNHQKAHRALDDAKATGELLIKYLNIFIEKGIKKINQLYYPKNKFELDRFHFQEGSEVKDILQYLAELKLPGHITLKGDKGMILAIVPSESFKDDLALIEELLTELQWNMVTVKITYPFLESLLYFASHYQKLKPQIQNKLQTYLENKLENEKSESQIDIQKLDFIISKHLIEEQVVIYSFLNLNLKAQNIFRVPAQQKKMYQYLISLSNRFESNQKGKRTSFIPLSLAPLIQNYLSRPNIKSKYLFASRKQLKDSQEDFFKTLEQYTSGHSVNLSYPVNHL